jgi:hypothetical protein
MDLFMTNHNKLNTVECKWSYGPFYRFCTFYGFLWQKNNYGQLLHDFLLNTFMGQASYGWLMDGQAIYGWFYGYIVQSF